MSNKKKTGVNPYRKEKPPKAVCGNCVNRQTRGGLVLGGPFYGVRIGRDPYLYCPIKGSEVYSWGLPCGEHGF